VVHCSSTLPVSLFCASTTAGHSSQAAVMRWPSVTNWHPHSYCSTVSSVRCCGAPQRCTHIAKSCASHWLPAGCCSMFWYALQLPSCVGCSWCACQRCSAAIQFTHRPVFLLSLGPPATCRGPLLDCHAAPRLLQDHATPAGRHPGRPVVHSCWSMASSAGFSYAMLGPAGNILTAWAGLLSGEALPGAACTLLRGTAPAAVIDPHLRVLAG
jgi:hypothetical protein